jgi:hypothetical protein
VGSIHFIHYDSVKAHRVSSLVLVKGFDIDPRQTDLWQRTFENVSAVAAAENVDLTVAESNIHELLEPIIAWDYAHGGCLAAVGLFLRRGFGRLYIPSTHSVEEQIPFGSNLALDSHWSTEQISFVHDGSESTRLNKVITRVAQSAVALQYLRVCYTNKNAAYNCGRCDKCLRTMVNLHIAGALERAKTFPNKLDLDLIAATPTIVGPDLQIFHNENLSALKRQHRDPALQRALEASLVKTITLEKTTVATLKARLAHHVTAKAIYLDYAYCRGYLYAAAARILGQRFGKRVESLTDCRPFTVWARPSAV